MFVANSHYTAGHAEIQAFGESASPRFSNEAVLNELGTYQQKTKYEVNEPLMEKWGSSTISQQFALIPPINGVGFPANFVNPL
jgi:hypothetical protein